MKQKISILLLAGSLTFIIYVPFNVFAQGTTPLPDNSGVTPLPDNSGVTPLPPNNTPKTTIAINTVDDVLKVIDRITNWMFTIFMAVAVIMILIAAFKYLTSGGGEDVGKAHKMILYAAVAIAVAVLAKGIVTVVEKIVTP